jgi:hypothetical protein
MKIFTLVTAALILGSLASAQSVRNVDKLNYISEGSDFYNGPVLQATVTSNNDVDVLRFTADNNRISDIVSGTTDEVISAEVSNQESYTRYTFRDAGRMPLSTIQIAKTTLYPPVEEFNEDADFDSQVLNYITSKDEIRNKCIDIDDNEVYTTKDIGYRPVFEAFDYKVNVYCFEQKNQLGSIGEIEKEKDIFETTWEVSNGQGKVETATISNAEVGDGACSRLGPDVRICWEGSATTGAVSPVSDTEMIMHSNSIPNNGGFRVIDSREYRRYTEALAGLDDDLDNYVEGKSIWNENVDEEEVVSSLNENAEQVYLGISDSEFSNAEFTSGGFTSGTMRVYTETLNWPEFDVEVKACRGLDQDECDAFVNIQKTIGVPKITDVSSSPFKELDTGEINLTYKNVGTSEGAFISRVKECGGKFSPAGGQERAELEAGESVTETFYVTASTNSTTQKSLVDYCTVEVTEKTTGQTLTETIQVEMEQQQSECNYYSEEGYGQQLRRQEAVSTEGVVLVRDVIYECSEDELGYEVKEKCGFEQEAVETKEGSNRYECIEAEDENGGNGGGGGDGGDGGDGTDCKVTLLNNPVGKDLAFNNPICEFNNWLDSVFGGLYGNLTLIASTLLGLWGFGLRGRVARLMSIATGRQLNIFGRNVAAEYVLGIALFAVGFAVGLNIMTNPLVKWGLIIITVIAAIIRVVLDGPLGLVDWIFPDAGM